jgi:hypothetical protein
MPAATLRGEQQRDHERLASAVTVDVQQWFEISWIR